MKYSRRVAKKVFKLLSEDEYTQRELCEIVGVDETTFGRWKKRYAEFAEGIENAKEALREKRLVQCSNSLAKLIVGFDFTETTTEYVRDDDTKKVVIRAQREVTKHVMPSLGAIIHYQSNQDPEHWQNKQRLEHTGKDGEDLVLRPLTDEEIAFLAKKNESKQ